MEKSFLNGLNQHGYAFQYRVLHEALTPPPADFRGIPWQRLDVEMPVAGTRIDFVLFRQQSHQSVRLLVAECKRVNPAFGTWCFARSPYPRPEWRSEQTATEVMGKEKSATGELQFTTGVGWDRTDRMYDISFELKSDSKGDAHPVSSDRDAIETACSQVLRGMNGLIGALGRDAVYRRFTERQDHLVFIPVVFTTAKLLTADVDLKETDLDSGELRELREVKAVDWLYLQYAQSLQIKHSLSWAAPEQDGFDELVARSYVRSVAIVSPRGIRPFLNVAAGHGW